MKRVGKLILGVALAFNLASAIADDSVVEVAGTKFSSNTTVAGKPLVLNGAGLRTKFLVKVYALGLYVPQKSNSASQLLTVNGPELVEIHMLRKVDAKTFVEALHEGLEANNSKDTLAKLQPQVNQLDSLMKSVGTANDGDVIKFEYVPASGTQLYVNGSKLGFAIGGGSDFYTAILKIWFGNSPVDKDLKTAVVGQ